MIFKKIYKNYLNNGCGINFIELNCVIKICVKYQKSNQYLLLFSVNTFSPNTEHTP